LNFVIILGSGLDNIASYFDKIEILKEDKKGVHHKRIYTALNRNKIKILFISGRKHYYEGFENEGLVENISFAREQGIKYLVITNAAGGINNNFDITDLMLIRSYISFNTLLNKYQKNIYIDNYLYEQLSTISKKNKILLHEGNYGYFTGPAYETPAEIRFLKKIGIDAAGMSTIPELSSALTNNIKVIAISVITNLLKENIYSKTAHNSVISTASRSTYKLGLIVNDLANELKNC
jgi:purine-nucleoside phosphorylase